MRSTQQQFQQVTEESLDLIPPAELFMTLCQELKNLGYEEEINWQANLQPCNNSVDFLMEACWVILNSGMKEQVARRIWNRIKLAWADGRDIAEVFKHKGKVKAIKTLKASHAKIFQDYQNANDKIVFLKRLPFIGGITCFHLAKNLGHDCVKPDRHLMRIANLYKMTPDQMCEIIAKETGEKKCVADIVLWRACNLGLI